MPITLSSKIDQCINRLEKCMDAEQVADTARWDALGKQIDAEIQETRGRLSNLRHARRVVERNARNTVAFPEKLKSATAR